MGQPVHNGGLVRSACRLHNRDARLPRQRRLDVPWSTPGVYMRRCAQLFLWIFVGLALAGCPRNNGNQNYKAGNKAVDLKDYDAAVDYFSKALAADPQNPFYRIKLNEARFQAGQLHVHQGLKLREKGDLQAAISEFQRAQILDPSSVIADQELKKTLDMLAEQVRTAGGHLPQYLVGGRP